MGVLFWLSTFGPVFGNHCIEPTFLDRVAAGGVAVDDRALLERIRDPEFRSDSCRSNPTDGTFEPTPGRYVVWHNNLASYWFPSSNPMVHLEILRRLTELLGRLEPGGSYRDAHFFVKVVLPGDSFPLRLPDGVGLGEHIDRIKVHQSWIVQGSLELEVFTAILEQARGDDERLVELHEIMKHRAELVEGQLLAVSRGPTRQSLGTLGEVLRDQVIGHCGDGLDPAGAPSASCSNEAPRWARRLVSAVLGHFDIAGDANDTALFLLLFEPDLFAEFAHLADRMKGLPVPETPRGFREWAASLYDTLVAAITVYEAITSPASGVESLLGEFQLFLDTLPEQLQVELREMRVGPALWFNETLEDRFRDLTEEDMGLVADLFDPDRYGATLARIQMRILRAIESEAPGALSGAITETTRPLGIELPAEEMAESILRGDVDFKTFGEETLRSVLDRARGRELFQESGEGNPAAALRVLRTADGSRRLLSEEELLAALGADTSGLERVARQRARLHLKRMGLDTASARRVLRDGVAGLDISLRHRASAAPSDPTLRAELELERLRKLMDLYRMRLLAHCRDLGLGDAACIP